MSRNAAAKTITIISCLRCSGATSVLGYGCSVYVGVDLKRRRIAIMYSIEKTRLFLHVFLLSVSTSSSSLIETSSPVNAWISDRLPNVIVWFIRTGFGFQVIWHHYDGRSATSPAGWCKRQWIREFIAEGSRELICCVIYYAGCDVKHFYTQLHVALDEFDGINTIFCWN